MSLDGVQSNPTGSTGDFETVIITNLDAPVSSVGGGGGGSDWSIAEKNQIRHRLSLDGVQSNPTGSTGDFETVIITNLDATVSSRSALDGAAIQSALSSQGYTSSRAGHLDQLAGRAIDKLTGLSLGQYFLDGGAGQAGLVRDSNGFVTAQRIRVFDASKDMTTVVAGAANGADGEIARIDLVGSPETGTTNIKNLSGALSSPW